MDKDESDKKALFIQRVCAFIIDAILVAFVASFIAYPFADLKSIDKLDKEMTNIMESYVNDEINEKTYLTECASISYQLARKNGTLNFITLFIEILYFVVFQLYNKGQTFGKKLLNIKVVSFDEQELSMNQLIYRSLIINSILYGFILFAFTIFANQYTYFYGMLVVEVIQYLIILISGSMVMFGKSGRGIHDLVSCTKVVRLN